MSGKFMKIKRILIPTLTLVMVASQLTGCASTTQKELYNMMANGESIAIEVVNPVDQSQGTELYFNWVELASLNSYTDFRLAVEDAMQVVPFGTSGKNGVIYVDAVGKHTNNSTLSYAFMNKKFISNVWDDETATRLMITEAKKIYVDVNSDTEALLAAYNAYYNLINDSEPGYANMYSTLTRLEAMSALAKATLPAQELTDTDFVASVGVTNETAAIASLMNDNVYVSTKDKSLDLNTANGVMTRAEFIYMLVNTVFSDEYNTMLSQDKIADAGLADAKNGNNLSDKIKFTTPENPNPERLNSYMLEYCIKVGNDKLPKEIYAALAVAKNKGVIGSETRWQYGITKGEALNFMTKAFEARGTSFSVDRGESTGEAVSGEVMHEFDMNEFRELCDPDVHCTYENRSVVIDIDMLSALNSWSVPYKGMTTDQLNSTAGLKLVLYFDGVFTKEQWYSYLLGDLDLNKVIEAHYEALGSSDKLTDEAQDIIDNITVDPDEWLAEQEAKEKENEDLANEILNQWLADQNKDKEPSGGGSNNGNGNGGNSSQNQGGGSSNNGGSSNQGGGNSNNSGTDDLGNAPEPDFGGTNDPSIDVDATKDDQGDSIGKGHIGG